MKNFIGSTIGTWYIENLVGKDPHRNYKYHAKCTECGIEVNRTLYNLRTCQCHHVEIKVHDYTGQEINNWHIDALTDRRYRGDKKNYRATCMDCGKTVERDIARIKKYPCKH